MSRLSTSAQTAGQQPSKQDTDAPRLTPRPTVSKSGEETGETMIDEMKR